MHAKQNWDQLRVKIFSSNLKTHSCKRIARFKYAKIAEIDKRLKIFLDELRGSIEKFDKVKFSTLFHDRLRRANKGFRAQLNNIQSTYGHDLKVNLYKFWALNTVSGDTKLLNCQEDKIQIGPTYGYNLQFSGLLQIMGKQVGRVYVNLVPIGSELKIGAWHVQQWNFKDKDPQAWFEEALGDAQKSSLAAGAKLDLTRKLLGSGGYLFYELADQVKSRLSHQFPTGWEEWVKNEFKDFTPIYVGSLLAKDGAGVVIRILVDEKATVSQLKERCEKMANRLYEKTKAVDFGGILCSFVTKTENPNKSGRKGSRFIPRSSVAKKQKKSL